MCPFVILMHKGCTVIFLVFIVFPSDTTSYRCRNLSRFSSYRLGYNSYKIFYLVVLFIGRRGVAIDFECSLQSPIYYYYIFISQHSVGKTNHLSSTQWMSILKLFLFVHHMFYAFQLFRHTTHKIYKLVLFL